MKQFEVTIEEIDEPRVGFSFINDMTEKFWEWRKQKRLAEMEVEEDEISEN